MFSQPYKRAEVKFQEMQELTGEGHNSKVHVVKDLHLDAELVVKTVSKATIKNPAEYFRESQILYLSSHPYVVPVHYACEDADSIYLAMPYYKKGSLNRRMDAQFLTMREVIRYAVHFLSGLHNIHSKGLVHFDIKPDNILLSDRDEAMISDFGLAKQTNYDGLAGQDRLYFKMLPPEAYKGEEFSSSFDVYQAGLTLYLMANGNSMFYEQYDQYGDEANFDRATFKVDVRNEKFPDRSRYLEHVPARFRNVVKKCLKADPAERYGSVLHIVNELATIDGADLDWRYEPSATDRRWTKRTESMHYDFVIDQTGAAVARKGAAPNSMRKISEFCQSGIKPIDVRRFFRSVGDA